MKSIFLYILTGLMLISCSKDKGNYRYQDLNELEVVDQYGRLIDGAIYQQEKGQDFVLSPQVTGSLFPLPNDQLDFYWTKDGDIVDRDKVWKVSASRYEPGIYNCKLMVVDKQTTLSYSYAFTLKVYAGLAKGSFILTEGGANESQLVMVSPDGRSNYIFYQNFGGYALGDKPLQLNVNYSTQDTLTYYNQLLFTTREGQYPMFGVDLVSLKPTYLFPLAGSVLSGELLRPSYYLQDAGPGVDKEHFTGMVIINGKCHYVESGVISPNIYPTDLLDYNFGERAALYEESEKRFLIAGFDRRNGRIRIFFTNTIGFFYGNYDDYPFPQLTKEHVFVAATCFRQGGQVDWQFLLQKGDEIALVTFNTHGPGNYIDPPVKVSKVIPEMIDGVGFIYHAGYWYFAKGRNVYRFEIGQLNIEPYLRLPDDGTGNICSWNLFQGSDGDIKSVGVATFNVEAAHNHQGSYYLYDIKEKKYIQQDQYVIDKAVDIKLCF
ncbi:PKD-like family lipoprotein [Olivibacter sp. CPCC 100613]|uniref:PKD-like family lipoprotein n=1 Tax=Olivibacter sp. CPCC 100613 TaxID=3079931 RepID=UPI002FFB858D